MATITVCPPDTIEDLEAALPVVWIGEPTYLDKLARETIAGLAQAIVNQPPPCDDDDLDNDIYADLRDPGDEFYIDLTTGECHRCDEPGAYESDRCPFGGDHDRGAMCYEVCGLDQPSPDDEPIILAVIGPLPPSPWLERRAAELLASVEQEACVSCQALGAWEREGALAYPLCPACKAQAAEEAREAEFADWIRTPAPFGGEE